MHPLIRILICVLIGASCFLAFAFMGADERKHGDIDLRSVSEAHNDR